MARLNQQEKKKPMGYEEAWKLAFARNPRLRLARGYRVKVPKGTKKVYIPRKNHSSKKVYTEDQNYQRLETFYDQLEPCVVTRGAFGWKPHRCPYHPLVIIEEQGT